MVEYIDVCSLNVPWSHLIGLTASMIAHDRGKQGAIADGTNIDI